MNVRKVRCWFCRMQDSHKWLGIPLCYICRDQLYDFFWVTIVQTLLWLFGGIQSWLFIVDECLLFLVLIFIKHRVPAPWENR